MGQTAKAIADWMNCHDTICMQPCTLSIERRSELTIDVFQDKSQL
jgi:hypothetical protein